MPQYRRFQQLAALWTVLIALWSPVASTEASHFLHSVHPSLSPAPPPHSHEVPDATPDGEYGDESDTAALLSSTAFGTFESPPQKRMPLPSPTLFSEEDRLLGNFPHLGKSRSRDGSVSGRPRSRSLQSRSRASLDQTEHGEPASTTTIEMPDLNSNGHSTTATRPAYEQGVRSSPRAERRQARTSFAREVRSLLRLRAATVACLREVLFDDDGGGFEGYLNGTDPEEEEERIETPTELSNGHLLPVPGAMIDGSRSTAAADDSRRRAHDVGERLKELGWRGGDLGTAKLL